MKLSDVLDMKGWETVTTREGVSTAEAVKLMCDKHVGAVVVTAPDGRIAGILTERDILRRFAEHGAKLGEIPVSKIMTRVVETTGPGAEVEEVLGTMTSRRFRHMPVVKGGKLAGLISIGDLVKAMLQEKVREAESLKQYITS
ncbi:MAG TPA: CBS domain-containing protein [Gammaproteobacteria bacterium]|nr:CBS domain-containing protein [Gammaproteobacteria bacterium]